MLSVVHAFVVHNSATQVPFQALTYIAKTAVAVEPKQTQTKTPETKNKKRKSDQKDDKPEPEEVVPPLDVSWLVRDSTPETEHSARMVKSVALSAAVHSLKTLCKITAESDYASGCVALLHTAIKLLRAVPTLLPTPIMKMIAATANLIAKSAAELETKRNPLTLHEVKPEPIKTLTPAFRETDEYAPLNMTRVTRDLIAFVFADTTQASSRTRTKSSSRTNCCSASTKPNSRALNASSRRTLCSLNDSAWRSGSKNKTTNRRNKKRFGDSWRTSSTSSNRRRKTNERRRPICNHVNRRSN